MSIIIISVGSIVVFGWIFDINSLKSIFPTYVSMKFSTSVSFVFSGITLYFISRFKEGKSAFAHLVVPASGLIIFLFMITLLLSSFISIRTGIEDIFVKETGGVIETTTPGRPSVATMLNFILIIAYGIFSMSDSSRLRKLAVWFGYAVTAVGGIALLGYVMNLPSLYYSIEGLNTAMALHTSILFVMLGSGIILLRSYNQEREKNSLKIRTKLLSLFLIASIIPIIFVDTLSYSVTRDPTSVASFGTSLLIIGGITIGTIAIFAFFTSKSIVKPILKIRDVASKIATGDLTVKADENSTDELGELAKAFNHMIYSIKLNESLKSKTEKLSEINKSKSEFIAMITHELKTPLVPIQGYVDLLLREHLGKLTEKQKERLEIVKNSSESLLNIVSDLLDVQKLELGQLKFVKKENNLKSMSEKAINTTNLQAVASKIQLANNVKDLHVYCDEARILQVIINLIRNSLKACQPEIGKIEISAEEFENEVKISVKDNGSGIPDSALDKLFHKFYQVDTSLTREHGGSGLGLSICKGIVEAHDGRIMVESKTGQGTTFSFTLPKIVSVKLQ